MLPGFPGPSLPGDPTTNICIVLHDRGRRQWPVSSADRTCAGILQIPSWRYRGMASCVERCLHWPSLTQAVL